MLPVSFPKMLPDMLPKNASRFNMPPRYRNLPPRNLPLLTDRQTETLFYLHDLSKHRISKNQDLSYNLRTCVHCNKAGIGSLGHL